MLFEVREWECSTSSSRPISQKLSSVKGDVKLGNSIELEKPAGLQGKDAAGEGERN